MDNTNLDPIKEKLAKLLELAKNNTNEHEAAAAAGKAAKLLQEYNLTEDEIAAHQSKPEIVDVDVMNFKLHIWNKATYKKPGPEPDEKDRDAWWKWWKAERDYRRKVNHRLDLRPKDGKSKWYMSLAIVIGHLNNCDCSLFSDYGTTYIGTRDRAEMAAFMMSNIYSRIQQMADAAVIKHAADWREKTGRSAWKEGGAAHPKLFRKGYIEGLAGEITQTLYETWMENRPKHRFTNPNPYALMVQGAIELYKASKFANVPEMSEKTKDEADRLNRGSWIGREAGGQDGKNFQLQSGVGGGGGIATKALKG